MEDSNKSKLFTKMKDDPMVPIGLLGLTGVVVYSIMNIKKKKHHMALYVIQTRVFAQGTLMGCMALGLVYSIYQNCAHKFFPDKKN